ncbi:MAG: hypothetical protein AMXMBFR58_21750 [Phycisphaerae bacterium]
MTNSNHRNSFNPAGDDPAALEPELAALDAALDELARRDAASTGPGFEDRIAMATMPRAGGRREESAGVVYTFAGSRRDVRFTAMRLAAMVALAVGGVLVWTSMRPAPSVTGPAILRASTAEQDLSAWLAMTESTNDLSELALDSESIDQSLSSEPAAGAWFLEGESL